ncbi:DUF1036 domain-containing protein [Streptomyces coeruleorubidus]|uniref:DUF1036 domain-containing protein n=1 Tax=Streptomyces coeruleorubidus TaxID=116188 RepID=A0ABZ0K3S6_STRC4|nr:MULTISPECIES: DUF1036 domain-containing protein [Streptomyces]WOT32722.1 DUF1036 domain-containing protein [Streptomyces coeruleorubidus]GGU46183.1 hypothetical protein GCM10010244_85030 [Streptomyces bellus]
MWLNYRNRHPTGLWLMVGYPTSACEGEGDWGSRGWYRLERDTSVIPLMTSNPHTTFFAEADDGVTWSGPFVVTVPLHAFDDHCWNVGVSTGLTVGMRLLTSQNAMFNYIRTIEFT